MRARLKFAIDYYYSYSLEDRVKKQVINGGKMDALKIKLLNSKEDSLVDNLKKARTYGQVARDVCSARQCNT